MVQTVTNGLNSKDCKGMTLGEQLLFVECFLPDAWEYLHDIDKVRLPKFDDNDDVVSWGVTPQDTPQDVNKREEKE